MRDFARNPSEEWKVTTEDTEKAKTEPALRILSVLSVSPWFRPFGKNVQNCARSFSEEIAPCFSDFTDYSDRAGRWHADD